MYCGDQMECKHRIFCHQRLPQQFSHKRSHRLMLSIQVFYSLWIEESWPHEKYSRSARKQRVLRGATQRTQHWERKALGYAAYEAYGWWLFSAPHRYFKRRREKWVVCAFAPTISCVCVRGACCRLELMNQLYDDTIEGPLSLTNFMKLADTKYHARIFIRTSVMVPVYT